ncbi:MAG TPA: isopentenyl-diphosphate Delta-isomerase [Flavisolibacter sp.]|nr:isopentenyl-diphosphate Delta-isomerase [Flavisolibacter sp.]
MAQNEVILVNEYDEPIGVMEKMPVHEQGLLHRAFSVFIFDEKGRMLLQQRAAGKYHGAGLWTNACCSHPFPGEAVENAAVRRLKEELGFTTTLQKIFTFTYHARVENDLIEHEFDHVFAGKYQGKIEMDPEEVSDYAYKEMQELAQELERHPERFTSWFKIAFPEIEKWWQLQNLWN